MVYLLAGVLIVFIVVVVGVMPLLAVNLDDDLRNAEEQEA